MQYLLPIDPPCVLLHCCGCCISLPPPLAPGRLPACSQPNSTSAWDIVYQRPDSLLRYTSVCGMGSGAGSRGGQAGGQVPCPTTPAGAAAALAEAGNECGTLWTPPVAPLPLPAGCCLCFRLCGGDGPNCFCLPAVNPAHTAGRLLHRWEGMLVDGSGC